ncbi:hypothetical protein [Halalkalicoccus jeotgali]|uniref:Uncharacterized protein n=1 Tax=Halalkalicoccus jeotgali (strain DSM 18796 / CECT 7217 / JCM 14584 / KCTC 4019 / B3) TaxID=795797 RepID=D8JBH3_HALJB|nr:hypothetical protein [Halalkalicoccus jeotgali]ADJ16626.1 hypothetical protein HacjB3_16351 [Halalkalicoccus jeotgali B3]ELY41277.1 hypothetical protein C497_00895 [Halalkalicoccus jeotgali B3]
MSKTNTPEPSVLVRLEDRIPGFTAALEQLKIRIVENSADPAFIEAVEEIWDIIEEAEDVLETVDFEELPDVIDPEELPDAIDMKKVPEVISTGDARDAIDLSELNDAVELRELWEAVDVPELRKQKQELDAEVADVTGDGNEEDDGLLDMEGMLDTGGANVDFDIDDRQKKMQELIETAVEKFRTSLLETHDKVRVLYEINQEKLGGQASLNPTVVSTMPKGPIPDSASTRVSTVPSQVKYSQVKNPRRIYGQRFKHANTK